MAWEETVSGVSAAKPLRRIVFYSWQSDLPNATNRGLIQQALEEATAELAADAELGVEPVVDRDTQGVPGSPDIARTILAKIRQSDVFVADVSFIDRPAAGRRAPNPNVLLELGYALHALGEERVILVFNREFGRVEDLPFDLRLRRTMQYESRPQDAERAPVRRRLAGDLQGAIKASLAVIAAPSSARQPDLGREEQELLRASLSTRDDRRGVIFLSSNDQMGEYVWTGLRRFDFKDDPARRARYVDALLGLQQRGLVRHESGAVYRVTRAGEGHVRDPGFTAGAPQTVAPQVEDLARLAESLANECVHGRDPQIIGQSATGLLELCLDGDRVQRDLLGGLPVEEVGPLCSSLSRVRNFFKTGHNRGQFEDLVEPLRAIAKAFRAQRR